MTGIPYLELLAGGPEVVALVGWVVGVGVGVNDLAEEQVEDNAALLPEHCSTLIDDCKMSDVPAPNVSARAAADALPVVVRDPGLP